MRLTCLEKCLIKLTGINFGRISEEDNWVYDLLMQCDKRGLVAIVTDVYPLEDTIHLAVFAKPMRHCIIRKGRRDLFNPNSLRYEEDSWEYSIIVFKKECQYGYAGE